MREDFYWLNKDSVEFLKRGYLQERVKPKGRIKQISDSVERISGQEGISERFYNYMSKGWISLSSPIWSNFGLDHRGYGISCYGITIQDSTSDILRGVAEIGMMSKYGGGTAVNFSNLRGRGKSISGGGVSNGVMSFLDMYQSVTDTISQNGVRRGSVAIYLDIDHEDIEEYLTIRDEDSPIQNLSFAVNVSDEWMQSMIDGDSSKRKVWLKVLKKREETGYPYIQFRGNVNNNKPQVYKDKGMEITHSNLCVSGETLVLTENGYEKIKELENKDTTVWNGYEWSKTKVFKTGVDKELLKVYTDSGQFLECTPEHIFYIQKGYKRGVGENRFEIIKTQASELKKGDKLIKFNLPIIEGEKELTNAYANGFFSGDGCKTPKGNRIYLYGNKIKLKEHFNTVEKWVEQPENNRIYGYANGLKDKFFVPSSDYTIETRLKWLSGLLDSDGTVANNKGSQSFQIASVNKQFLQEIQLMLQTLGVHSKITLMRTKCKYLLPSNDGTGELKEFDCKEVSRLLINGNSMYDLTLLGLKCNRLTWSLNKPNREASTFIKISSIEKVNTLKDTFCFTEDKRNLGMFNGILTGQCNEIQLHSSETESFVCCISSVNLEHFDDWKDDPNFVFDFMVFLDSVMKEFIQKASGIPFFEKAVAFAINQNAVGLGVLGLHSYLQKNMIPFEGLQCKMKLNQIFKHLEDKTLEASKELAKIYGEPPLLKGYGERFTTRMAIAPTTSSSFILGQVSPSIEPLNSNYFLKDVAKGRFAYRNPYLEQLLETKGLNTFETWESILKNNGSVQHLDSLSQEEKNVFKTFDEISQLEVVQNVSIMQKYVDQGISMNVKIHPDTPVKDINALIIEGWKLGVKGFYYNRSTNKAQELGRDLLNCSSCEA